jgi:AMP deaminase
LGDNPRDHDSVFSGFDGGDVADVAGVRPEIPDPASKISSEPKYKPWKLYPPPPPPHWHWTDSTQAPGAGESKGTEEFDFEKCEIPGGHDWEFSMDDKGVFQVYGSSEGAGRDLCF